MIRSYSSILLFELLDQIIHISQLQNRNEIFNLCSGKGTSFIDIVTEFKKIKKNFNVIKDLPYRQNEIMKIIGSNNKLIETGYDPKVLNLKKELQRCLLAK